MSKPFIVWGSHCPVSRHFPYNFFESNPLYRKSMEVILPNTYVTNVNLTADPIVNFPMIFDLNTIGNCHDLKTSNALQSTLTIRFLCKDLRYTYM